MTTHAPPPPFQRIYLEITNRCNLRCDFCPGTSRPPVAMSLESIECALAHIAPLTKQVCLHVLGEPLMHPHFPEILTLCDQADLEVILTTNGTLIETMDDVMLQALSLHQVNFSLQALDRAPDFDRGTLESVLKFCQRALEHRPDLFINLRLWTLDGIRAALDTPFGVMVTDAIATALEIALPHLPPGRKSRRLRGRIYLHRDTVFAWPGNMRADPHRSGFCHALSTHCAILVDGTVCPCCLDADGHLALGNINCTSLADILASPRAIAMRDGFSAGVLVETMCQSCTYCRRFTKTKGTRTPPTPPHGSK